MMIGQVTGGVIALITIGEIAEGGKNDSTREQMRGDTDEKVDNKVETPPTEETVKIEISSMASTDTNFSL